MRLLSVLAVAVSVFALTDLSMADAAGRYPAPVRSFSRHALASRSLHMKLNSILESPLLPNSLASHEEWREKRTASFIRL